MGGLPRRPKAHEVKMGHIWFLSGVLGFAAICALILSDRWHSLSLLKVRFAAGLSALSGIAHFVAAGVDSETFQLSLWFGGIGLLLAAGWYALSTRLLTSQGDSSDRRLAFRGASAPLPKGLLSQHTQRSLAAASTALAFASALAVYMSRIV